jgi:MarR family transcriptional regulator, organic hydroperoxide resistance regulator
MEDLKAHYNTCLYHASSSLFRTLARLADEHFKPLELSPTQGFILMTLKAAPGIVVGDLAIVHQLDQTTISRTLDKMVLKGLVKREGTGRAVRVFGTTRGLRKEAEAQAAWKKLRMQYTDLLGEAEVRLLAGSVSQADATVKGA